MDRSHDPEGTRYILHRVNLDQPLILITETTCNNEMRAFTTQALHLIGQALIEEKIQLEDSTVEEVTFDFSLKARSE